MRPGVDKVKPRESLLPEGRAVREGSSWMGNSTERL
jgi:hypothetical protein